MIDWIPNLPVVLIALVALVGMTSLTLAIYALVMHLAESERADALQALSPGMLPPMGILFALIVGFLAVGVWGNVDRAEEVISDEASALRSVVILSDDLPPDVRMRMRAHIRRQIEGAVHEEWPAMREQRATLSPVPAPLADALHLALRVHPQRESETEVQRELVTSIQDALDARRQRIFHSESGINAVKWLAILHGDLDASAPIRLTGEKTAVLIPGSRLLVYRGSGHGPYAADHERVNADILTFINGQRALAA